MSDSREGVAVHSTPSPVSPGLARSPNGWPAENATRASTYDGRHARAERTRQAVLDGLKECLIEDISQPTAKQVAERAGVSLRGVFRHFDHLDSLLLQLDQREHERLMASMRPCRLDAPLKTRIDTFLRSCARVYEHTAPVQRALQRYMSTSETIQRHREKQRLVGHQKIMELFAAELDALPGSERQERVREISALTSWTQWEELRRFEHLTAVRARKILARGISAVLAQSAAA